MQPFKDSWIWKDRSPLSGLNRLCKHEMSKSIWHNRLYVVTYISPSIWCVYVLISLFVDQCGPTFFFCGSFDPSLRWSGWCNYCQGRERWILSGIHAELLGAGWEAALVAGLLTWRWWDLGSSPGDEILDFSLLFLILVFVGGLTFWGEWWSERGEAPDL